MDLGHPTGTFTGSKLAQLGSDPALCRALLRDIGADERPVPPRSGGPNCGYRDGMRLGPEPVGFRPAGPVTSCSVAAGLHLLETRVIQPAARRHLGTDVAAIDHAGSYSCRRLYGRPEGSYSEHATADAIDILGFQLADGGRVSVRRDWGGETAEARFLRDVRDGSCRFFSTVLSPDCNAAHADHLHLDQAERGSFGWRACK